MDARPLDDIGDRQAGQSIRPLPPIGQNFEVSSSLVSSAVVANYLSKQQRNLDGLKIAASLGILRLSIPTALCCRADRCESCIVDSSPVPVYQTQKLAAMGDRCGLK